MCDKLVDISPFFLSSKKNEGRTIGEKRSKTGSQPVFFVNQKLFTEMDLYFFYFQQYSIFIFILPPRKKGRDF